jgi:hypothetical protein
VKNSHLSEENNSWSPANASNVYEINRKKEITNYILQIVSSLNSMDYEPPESKIHKRRARESLLGLCGLIDSELQNIVREKLSLQGWKF